MIRSAVAHWKGTGKEGSGHLTTKNGVLDKTPYSFLSRFEYGEGTNPEELIAAAHAGCFTMKMSFVLTEAGFPPTDLETTCKVTLEEGNLIRSQLFLRANVENISREEFDKLATNAEKDCPVSKALNMEIILESTLNGV